MFNIGAAQLRFNRPLFSYIMKKILFVFLTVLIASCSSSDGDAEVDEIPVSSVTQQPEIKPYSCDITSNGIEVVYTVMGASKVNVLYKEQLDDNWTSVEHLRDGKKVAVKLTNLQLYHYSK